MSNILKKIIINDVTKKQYVIMRDTPNGPIVISGTFSILENAKNECKKRIKFGKESNNVYTAQNGWSEPYLVEIKVELEKIKLD